MAEIKRQPPRKRVGFSDLLILIFTAVIIGIIIFAFGDRTKTVQLDATKFYII